MERFSSLNHVPAETRRLLRDRFRGFLPSYRPPKPKVERPLLHDELALRLLLGVEIDWESSLDKARSIYEAQTSDDVEPTFDDLVRQGRLRVVWGRVSAPVHMRVAATGKSEVRFKALMAKRHGQIFRFSDELQSLAELATTVEALQRDGQIACQTPEWVAARLWDRSLVEPSERIPALRIWVDRWRAIGAPSFVPSHAWSVRSAEAFEKSALEVIRSTAGLDDWNQARARILSELALSINQPPSSMERDVPALPATNVGRALWLENNRIEVPLMEGLTSCGDLFGLMRILLADVRYTDSSPAPNKLAERVITLAVGQPDLLHMLIRSVKQHSEILADLLFCPSTSALACLLVAQWQAPHSAWDRELTLHDFHTSKVTAFTDAVSVMAQSLKRESVNPAEVAALFEWLHTDLGSRTASLNGSADSVLEILRAELVSQAPETLRKMVEALTASMPDTGLGTATFAATLDIIDTGNLVAAVDASPIIDAYIRNLAEGHYSLTAHRVTQGSALSLFQLATRLGTDRLRQFLYPIDVRARLSAGSEENPYTLSDNIARSIRAHISVLSRAVAASTESAPEELVDALVAAIQSGAVEHKERGRVAAFAPRFETQGGFASTDRPIAADIGASLHSLTGERRDRVLNAMLQTDEPMVLAQLSTFAPQALRERIAKRVLEIDPSDAGATHSLTEIQARIDQLLTANMAAAAARFMDEERNVKTFGKVPGRSITRLHAELKLLFLRGDWDKFAKIEPPQDISQSEQPSANETISFFRAIAELKRPSGDIEGAEQVFARLFHRHPGTAAYAVNLFAARINLLLGTNAFAVLDGAALTRGRQLLAETEQIANRMPTVAESEVFASNIALLLLATGQPEAASQTLASRQIVNLRDTVAAYNAVALSRLGRSSEAIASLKVAEESFGATDVLRAAREYIENGSPYASTASVSSETESLPEARRAHHDFLQMDPQRQARVVRSSAEKEPFDSLVIDCVRSSAASAIALVPVVKTGGSSPMEDDITAVVGEVLAAHILFLEWSLGPSPGGVTAKGNQGRRDLVLRKGTTTLAVIEAVMCTRPITHEWSRNELSSHFQKLFAYSPCTLLFHLTYATIENPSSIIDHLRRVAKEDAPSGFSYIDSEDIPLTDSRPTGLVARYKGEFGEIKVVFLILDLGQHSQNDAAGLSARTNPRNKKT